MTLRLVSDDGTSTPLPLDRWLGDATPAEIALLRALPGPVLDVGCGPGRHLVAVSGAGVAALGIDTSPEAVALARRRGGTALLRSVFDALPGEGRWGAALLLDGNIGIGGDPVALLRRLAAVVAAGGTVLAELEPGRHVRRMTARLQNGGPPGPRFPWARVGIAAADRVAAAAGLRVSARREVEGRWFASLAR